MTKSPGKGTAGSILSTKLKVTGIDLFSAGNFSGGEDCSDLTFHDSARRIYKKLVLRDGRLEGVVLYGDVADSGWYFELLRKCEDVTAYRDGLLFGQNIVAAMGNVPKTSSGGPARRLSNLRLQRRLQIGRSQMPSPPRVLRRSMRSAPIPRRRHPADPVHRWWKSLLKASLGDAFQKPAAAGMCKCTSLTHEEVRRRIKDEHL